MKFIVDAHLPHRIAYRLKNLGYDTVHTLDLPFKNRTPDSVIEEISLQEQRVVITRDADFVDSFTPYNKPFQAALSLHWQY